MAEVRRLERHPGGRKHAVKVLLSDEERAELVERAEEARLSVPRLLVESALAGGRRTASERRGLVAEFLAVRRLVAAIGNNVNQLARAANATNRTPAELPVVLDALKRVLDRLDGTVAALRKP
ncbi:hypothetical protein GCM10022221_81970 [Actinocorallia aurea]